MMSISDQRGSSSELASKLGALGIAAGFPLANSLNIAIQPRAALFLILANQQTATEGIILDFPCL